MCEPMMLLSLAGAGMSAMGAMQQADAQKAAAQAQAAQYRAQQELQQRQANIEATAGQYQEQQKRVKLDALAGQQRNIIAGSGFTSGGSGTDVIIDSRREGELDVAAVKFGTTVKTDNLYYQSAVSGMNAKSADNAASMIDNGRALGVISPFISAFSSLSKTKLGGSFGGGTATGNEGWY